MKRLVTTLSLISGLFLASNLELAHASSIATNDDSAVVVIVDKAKVFRVSRPAATVIIGNPSIADATVEDDQTIILTGRSFGVTNLIVLDENGDAVVDQDVVVQGSEANTVRVYRQSSRETFACAPVCERTLTIGDNHELFESSSAQIDQRNKFSEQNAN